MLRLNSTSLIINSLVLAVAAFVIGFRPLEDYDLGWHLTAGLWIIENGTLPYRDFLGAEGNLWVCYSWLFEVFLGAIYLTFGFKGLQFAQLFLVAFALFLLQIFLQVISKNSGAADNKTHLFEILVLLFSLIFLAPFCHLRPQLLSAVFFAMVIVLHEIQNARLRYLMPIFIVWTNIHVFWILGVLVSAAYELQSLYARRISLSRAMTRLFVISLAALASPYAFKNVLVVWDYAFSHKHASKMIDEFASFGMSFGFVFIAYFLACSFALLKCIKSKERGVIDLIFWIIAALVLWQRKYLLLFAFMFPLYVVRKKQSAQADFIYEQAYLKSIFGLSFSMLPLLVAMSFLFPVSALNPKELELMELTHRLRNQASRDEAVVFNHFDDGGWLGLALWRARLSGENESPIRTAIDGRTLVMKEQRLSDYARLRSDTSLLCETVQKWQPRFVILPLDSPLQKIFSSSLSEASCGRWREFAKGEYWSILLRDEQAIVYR